MTESFDDKFNETFPSFNNQFPYVQGYMPDSMPPPQPYPMPGQPAHTPFFGTPYTRSKDVWRVSHVPGQTPTRYVGDEILNVIRSIGGGIVYTKRNDFQYWHYVDQTVVYRFDLVPSLLIPVDESEPRFTEIGKSWVRQEALDLLGYTYSETQSGHFCVSGNLELVSDTCLGLTMNSLG